MSKKYKPGELEQLQDLFVEHFACSSKPLTHAGDILPQHKEEYLNLQVINSISSSIKDSNSLFPPSILKQWHINVFIKLRLIAQYFEGEFKPITKDKSFLCQVLSVWSEIISGWYFGTIYLGYGEDLVDIEKAFISENELNITDDRVKFWCKLRVYKKQATKDDNGNVLFTSLLSNVTGIAINPDRLVVCSCNHGINWLCWFDLLREYIIGQQRFITALKASQKRVVVSVNNLKAYEREISQLQDNEVTFEKIAVQTQGLNNNIYKPFEFMPLEAPEIILKNIQAWFELNASLLGFAGKALNNKTERMNLIETEQNLSLVSNMRERNLRSLKVVILRMREVFGSIVPEDFDVVISSDNMLGLMNNMNQQEEQIGSTKINTESDVSFVANKQGIIKNKNYA